MYDSYNNYNNDISIINKIIELNFVLNDIVNKMLTRKISFRHHF